MFNYELFIYNVSLMFEVECELKMKIDKKVYNWLISLFLNIDCFFLICCGCWLIKLIL